MQVTLRVMSFVSMIKEMSINTAIVALLFSYCKLLYSELCRIDIEKQGIRLYLGYNFAYF